jgi:hypothetical protein
MCHFDQIYGKCQTPRSDFEFFALRESWDEKMRLHCFEDAHRQMQAYLRRFHVEIGPPDHPAQWQVTFPSGLKLAWEEALSLPLTGPRLNCLLLKVRKTLSLQLPYPRTEPDCQALQDVTLEYDLYDSKEVLPGVSWQSQNVEHFFQEWTHPHTEIPGWSIHPLQAALWEGQNARTERELQRVFREYNHRETERERAMREYYTCDCQERH